MKLGTKEACEKRVTLRAHDKNESFKKSMKLRTKELINT